MAKRSETEPKIRTLLEEGKVSQLLAAESASPDIDNLALSSSNDCGSANQADSIPKTPTPRRDETNVGMKRRGKPGHHCH